MQFRHGLDNFAAVERRHIIERIRLAVEGFYTPGESRIVAYETAERFCGFSRAQAVADPSAEAVCDEVQLEEVCRQLAAGRPVQYVTGFTEFCGLRLSVAEGVLIPRPETEELVAWITDSCAGRRGVRFLDAGTGSGAIAIALARLLDSPVGDAVDISDDALEIARRNALDNHADVRFRRADLLASPEAFEAEVGNGRYDIIVSNPPYIPRSEWGAIRENVKGYEPHLALFVEDSDPLIFYREIGRKAQELLVGGGELFFEIHENFARAVCELLTSLGFVHIVCRRDMNGKPRMIRCVKR